MSIGGDLGFAFRMLRRNPGFSAVAVATLAFGIGANTAIYSVFDAVLLRPLGYGDESRLFAIHEIVPKLSQSARVPVNAMHFEEWRRSVTAFREVAMIGGLSLNLTGAGEPERLAAARVSSGLFPMLGARARLGRTFLEEDDRPGRDHVVLLSDRLWKRRFASDPAIVGRKIVLDGRPYQVVGVLSSGFHFPRLSQLYAMTIAGQQPELWKPFAVEADEREPLGDFNYACIARLRPGVSPRAALAELNAVQARLAAQAPEKIELFASLVPLQNQITGRSSTGLGLVLGAVALVLLIGCVNIANLLLARGASRKRELAIRSALGAGAGRLLRQMTVESLVLAGIGGALGTAMAWVVLPLILAYAPADVPRLDEVHLDARILLFAVAVTILAGLLFGLLPAWRLRSADPQQAMQARGRGSTEGRSSGRLRSLLVSVQVGLSTLCLIAGALLLHSFWNLLAEDKGFAVHHVVTVDLNLPDYRYPHWEKPGAGGSARVRFMRSLVDSVRVLPGVVSAGISNMLPLGGEGGNNQVTVEGAKVPLMERPLVDFRSVNSDYFRTMGIPLRRGRIFAEGDGERKMSVVSALTAERLWPGQDPVGRRFKLGDPDGPWIEVAGVVGDVRGVALDKPPSMTVYLPYWQRRVWGGPSLAVRTAADPRAVLAAIRGAIHRIDPELPVPRFQTMEQIVDESLAQRRFQMTLVLLFAAAALALASLGIYGVVSYSVTSRTNEFGIRMAVGACRPDILNMILRQAMVPVGLGVCGGIVASVAAGRLLAGLLYGVASVDAVTILGVALTLAAVATLASIIPARRATRLDPLTALRYE